MKKSIHVKKFVVNMIRYDSVLICLVPSRHCQPLPARPLAFHILIYLFQPLTLSPIQVDKRVLTRVSRSIAVSSALTRPAITKLENFIFFENLNRWLYAVLVGFYSKLLHQVYGIIEKCCKKVSIQVSDTFN